MKVSRRAALAIDDRPPARWLTHAEAEETSPTFMSSRPNFSDKNVIKRVSGVQSGRGLFLTHTQLKCDAHRV